MNIVFHRYNSICEPGYLTAFRSLGLSVIEDLQDINDPAAGIQAKMEYLASLIAKHRPMFVFSINYFPYISLVCDRFHVIYAAVSVDCPVAEIYDVSVRSPYNRLFLFDREQYLSICDENPGGVFHLALGSDPDCIEEAIGSFYSFAGHEEYDYDVSFVGSLYSEKDEYSGLSLESTERARLDQLIENQKKVRGLSLLEDEMTESDIDYIRKADPAFRSSSRSVRDISRFYAIDLYCSDHLTSLDRLEMLNHLAGSLTGDSLHLFTGSDTAGLNGVICHGRVDSQSEMPYVFRRSRINLNITMRAIRTGLPQRIWDVLGSGGFLLTDAQTEIPDHFEIGRHLDVYEDLDELVRKTKWWLQHDDERRSVAMAGYELVKAKHLVKNRVEQMIRIIYSTLLEGTENEQT